MNKQSNYTGLLNSCQDEMWHMVNRMHFLKEIYNSIGFGHYENLLSLVFEDIDKFIVTIQNLIDSIEAYRSK